jgi:tRNA-dihydrouridine synthase
MITIHGRTRCQFYKGRADWTAIRRTKAAVSVPVVANGDLVRAEDAPSMLTASGADAVMIGRGACGQPWIVGQTAAFLAGQEPAPAPVGAAMLALILEHYDAMLAHYGPHHGVRIARKHIGWYMDRLTVPDGLRKALLTSDDHRIVTRMIGAVFADGEARAAA